MSRIHSLLDQLDLLLARAGGLVEESEIVAIRNTSSDFRERAHYVDSVLIVALAGGTGSGKSSLLNAIAGEVVTSVSRLRPHTDQPVAWVPEGSERALRVLLDRLGVDHIVTNVSMPGVAIIDLPDMDSMAEWHRRTVEDLIPKVDAVIWVFDPEKYHDPVLHDEFLAPMVDYADQFFFVLNQVDRLDDVARERIANDLFAALEAIGYPAPRVFETAASPLTGAPQGLTDLMDFLAHRLDAKRVAEGKLVTDIRAAVATLGESAGVWTGTSVDYEARWDRVVGPAAAALVPGSGRAAMEDALCRIEDFIAAVSVETGGRFGERMRGAFTTEAIEAAVTSAAEAAAALDVDVDAKKPDYTPFEHEAARTLGYRIGSPLRDVLWERARFGAVVASLGVRTEEARAKLRPQPGSDQ